MEIIKKRRLWFTISLILIVVGLLFLPINSFMGKGMLNYDVEFVGGTQMLISIGEDFNNDDIMAIVKDVTKQPAPQIQKILGKQEVNIKVKSIDEETRKALIDKLKAKYPNADILEVSNVSSTISGEMQRTALFAVTVACLAMLIYITFRFKDIKSGLSAILALLHDVLIVISVYAIFRIPINNSFIAAMLTIVGYSINNTIVIFDRIRENKTVYKKGDLENLVDNSVKQTLTRSIFTSLTTLFTITSIYVLGVSSIKEFAMPIIVGIIAGTYSSIFISTSLWYVFNVKSDKNKTAKN